MWTLKKVLYAEKEAIGLLCDGGGKHSSVVAPFLNTRPNHAAPTLLHLATRAPIAVVAVLRTRRSRYKVQVYDVIATPE